MWNFSGYYWLRIINDDEIISSLIIKNINAGIQNLNGSISINLLVPLCNNIFKKVLQNITFSNIMALKRNIALLSSKLYLPEK